MQRYRSTKKTTLGINWVSPLTRGQSFYALIE